MWGEDSEKAVSFVAMFTLGTLTLSLVPTFVFFTAKGSKYRRLAFGCAITLVLFLAYLLLARGAMSSITYAAAGNLEIRQVFSARFVLDDRISLADLDNVQWRTRLAPANRVEVEAFQLFAFGDILLLCPSSLRRATLYELPRYSRQCLLTRSSKVDRKPPPASVSSPGQGAAILAGAGRAPRRLGPAAWPVSAASTEGSKSLPPGHVRDTRRRPTSN